MSNSAAVGVIGIGLLGQAFVHRLRSAGFDVVGFDVDAGKNARLVELGGQVASSVADLARRCDPLVLAVFSTDQVEAVVENELLPALGAGLREDRAVRQHVRPRTHRGLGAARGNARAAPAGDPGLGRERTGKPRRGRRADRR